MIRRADSMADMFGNAALPGLSVGSDFITADEERDLTRRIDATGLAPFRFQGWEGKRLTASFGIAYDFEAGKVQQDHPLPEWIEPLRRRAASFAGLPVAELVQALLTRYDPGAGIGWHRDRPAYAVVIGVSLGAPASLRFRKRRAEGFDRFALPLARRSIYCLSGEARHDWEHGIVAQADTRWSITLRSLSALGRRAVRQA